MVVCASWCWISAQVLTSSAASDGLLWCRPQAEEQGDNLLIPLGEGLIPASAGAEMRKICKDFGGEAHCPLLAFRSAPTLWRDEFQPYLNATDTLDSFNSDF